MSNLDFVLKFITLPTSIIITLITLYLVVISLRLGQMARALEGLLRDHLGRVIAIGFRYHSIRLTELSQEIIDEAKEDPDLPPNIAKAIEQFQFQQRRAFRLIKIIIALLTIIAIVLAYLYFS